MPQAKVTWASPAKINWNLRVLHRRPDGYHEIESLVSPLNFIDLLTFVPRDQPGVAITCEDPNVPLNDRNLIVRAAKLLAADSSTQLGALCRLVKHIPIGGGLGGGSSNAAAALVALNELWQLGRTRDELRGLAAQVGSDVPFFLLQGSGIIRGRGERIKAVEVDFSGYVVLLMPDFSTSTPAVYAAFQAAPLPEGGPRVLDVYPAAGLDARGWMHRTFNDLEPAALKVCPALWPLMERATKLADRPVRMSGSGSTLFTAFDVMQDAEVFAHAAADLNVRTRVTRIGLAAGTTDSSI